MIDRETWAIREARARRAARELGLGVRKVLRGRAARDRYARAYAVLDPGTGAWVTDPEAAMTMDELEIWLWGREPGTRGNDPGN